jgi:hypothetical protein
LCACPINRSNCLSHCTNFLSNLFNPVPFMSNKLSNIPFQTAWHTWLYYLFLSLIY